MLRPAEILGLMSEAEQAAAFRLHEAQTARLKELAAFVVAFAPAIGERSGLEVEIEPSPAVEESRNAAIVAAFRAIESIAIKSA